MQGQHHSFRGLAVFHANSGADNSGYTSVSLHWLDISLLAPARICLAMCSSVSHVSHIVNIFFHLFQSDSVRHEIKIWQIRIVLSYFLVKQFGRAQQNTTHGSKLSLESCSDSRKIYEANTFLYQCHDNEMNKSDPLRSKSPKVATLMLTLYVPIWERWNWLFFCCNFSIFNVYSFGGVQVRMIKRKMFGRTI